VSILDLYVFGTLCCWSVWGIFDKKALNTSSHAGVLLRLYVMSMWETPLIYAYMFVTNPSFKIPDSVWFWTFWAALSQLLSFAAYLVALSITDASLVLGVTAAYPIITQLLAVVFLREAFVAGRLVGAIAIGLGVFAIGSSGASSSTRLSKDQSLKVMVCMVLATVGWGVWGILDKLAVSGGTALETWLAECIWELSIVMVAFALCRMRGYKVELANRPAWFFAFLSALSLAIGRFTFLCALNMSSASYVLTITGCYPLLMYFLAVLFLQEKFDRVRFLGILLVVAGAIVVQLTQCG
jgi:uncharacterized membrane protein